MRIPTPEEIESAGESITRDGPAAKTTLELGVLTRTDPLLRGWLERVTASLPAAKTIAPGLPLDAVFEAALGGALIYGLNLGIRIGEARAKTEGPA